MSPNDLSAGAATPTEGVSGESAMRAYIDAANRHLYAIDRARGIAVTGSSSVDVQEVWPLLFALSQTLVDIDESMRSTREGPWG